MRSSASPLTASASRKSRFASPRPKRDTQNALDFRTVSQISPSCVLAINHFAAPGTTSFTQALVVSGVLCARLAFSPDRC